MNIYMFLFVGALNLLCCVDRVYSAPVSKLNIPSVETFDFMRKYGYIPDDGDHSAALFTEDGLDAVIKEIQKFGALEQTGKLDNATLALMNSSRCGVPDVLRDASNGRRTKRFVLGPKGWNKRSITFFIANWSGKLSEDIVARYITQGLETWGRYANLQFRRVYSPEADIIVAFGRGYHGDTYPFDGPGNILAHAFFPYEHDNLGGDIHFDDDENWTEDEDPQKGTNFFQVAIHELGHSLGLSHSPVRTSVMFAYYTGSGPQTLDYDDILGMYELYIKRRLNDDNLYWSSASTTTATPSWVDTSTSSTTEWSESDLDEHWNASTTRWPTSSSASASSTSTISYHGDSETVDEHKTHDPTHHIPPTQAYPTYPPARTTTRKTHAPHGDRGKQPDICQGRYDAIATLRNELFVFKGEYLWRLRKEYDVVPGYPVPFRQMFPLLPKSIKRIHAAYQRPDGQIVLFSGKQYWVFDGSAFVEGTPRPLTDLGLPEAMEKLDAVQNWARNGKTYFYRGNMFWRYDEGKQMMDEEYPMRMDRWRGVPGNLDAATTWRGTTYFFKGRCYWRFDNEWIITTRSSPLPTPQTWFGCPKEEVESCVPSQHAYPWE